MYIMQRLWSVRAYSTGKDYKVSRSTYVDEIYTRLYRAGLWQLPYFEDESTVPTYRRDSIEYRIHDLSTV